MFALGLLTCIALRAFSAQAKVVSSFAECNQFFYKQTEPIGMDQNAQKICQKIQYADFYYATLYSVRHRIPLYSAYTLDNDCSSTAGRTDDWHVEPQISQRLSPIDYMVLEKNYNLEKAKVNQAISRDYTDTGYDRGHLNPNSFQCDEGRTATFTLTNAAPMDACFNRVHWKSWESKLRSFLMNKLNSDDDSGTAFIVTGTVPNTNVRIPQQEISAQPERVSVPSNIWTAVCFEHFNDEEKSLSFGYIGKNRPEGGISLMSISSLNYQLSQLYSELSGTSQSIKVFTDDCFGDNNKLAKVQDEFQKLINLPTSQAVQMSSDIQKTFSAVTKATSGTSISAAKRFKVAEMKVKLAFDSLSTYLTVAEELKVFARSPCLITQIKPLEGGIVHDELRKRDVSEVSDEVECLLVPEKQKTAADGSPCSGYDSLMDHSDRCSCVVGREVKSCCSSPCLYQHKLNDYRCYSGQVQIPCSPRYSLVTANGERCKDDKPCAKYGRDHYWCTTVSGREDYCSPPLWRSKAKNGKYCRSGHACAKYNTYYPWCYTDENNNYDECCTSDDCHSAVNGKTCKPDHPCGYHGSYNLWCYTTVGRWDYCCTACDL